MEEEPKEGSVRGKFAGIIIGILWTVIGEYLFFSATGDRIFDAIHKFVVGTVVRDASFLSTALKMIWVVVMFIGGPFILWEGLKQLGGHDTQE